ncbi:hypothetical protein BDZ97DRAFT_1925008 [Flammula alnicola]|nr:hypothetical protein BDZ97DRAFT_1925008 [Flammula alnicola]
MTSITAAFEKLSSIEPLDAGASPRKVQAFRAKAQKYLRLSQDIVTHLTGIITASGLDPDADDSESEPPPPPPNGKLTMAIKRIRQLEGSLTISPLTPQEFAGRLYETGKGSKQAEEQISFASLLRGYAPAASLDDWYDILDMQPADLNWHIQSVHTESIDDISQRLLEREKALAMIQGGTALRGLANSIITCIHAVRFAQEWKDLSTARGGKKKKVEYRKAAFKVRYPNVSVDDYESELKAFTNRHEKVVTARNTLFRIYSKFHIAVLLDPLWTPIASYDHGTIGRSPSFALTLDRFMHFSTPQDPYFQKNLTTFKQLIEIMFSEETVKYVDEFLDEFPF